MTLRVHTMHEVFGAAVADIDVGALDDTVFEEVRLTVHRYGFGLFRQQSLDPDSIVRLARRFGDPLPGYRPEFTHPGYEELVLLGNIEQHGKVSTYLNTQGVEWHSDGPGAVLPPNVTMLYAVEAPSKGGDTLFASSVAAYQTLSPELKHTLSGLQVVNSFDHHNDKVATFGGTNVLPRVQQLRVGNPDKIEKLVQIHPVTGEQHLFVTHQMVKQVIGLEDSEGMDLVMQLVDHMTQPQLVYRHHWSPGDLIVFDNRSTIHSATAYDYPNERRLMYQIIIGERLGSSEPRTNVD